MKLNRLAVLAFLMGGGYYNADRFSVVVYFSSESCGRLSLVLEHLLNIGLLSSCLIISQYTQAAVVVQIVYVKVCRWPAEMLRGVDRNYDFSATGYVCRSIGLCEHCQYRLVTKFRRTRTMAGKTEAHSGGRQFNAECRAATNIKPLWRLLSRRRSRCRRFSFRQELNSEPSSRRLPSSLSCCFTYPWSRLYEITRS